MELTIEWEGISGIIKIIFFLIIFLINFSLEEIQKDFRSQLKELQDFVRIKKAENYLKMRWIPLWWT